MVQSAPEVYSVYLSEIAVELHHEHHEKDADSREGRLICSQHNYHSILEFAIELARYKRLPLQNYTTKR